MNRRDFFRPRRLAAFAGQALGFLDECLALEPPARESSAEQGALLLRFARRAMATTFEVVLPFGTPNAVESATAALDVIDRLEDQLTIYRDHSEMSQLNRVAPHTAVVVEDGLFGLLQTASRLHNVSQGAFDVSAGALIRAWGFFRGPPRVPSDQERLAALNNVGMQHVSLDPEAKSVRYERAGLEINLGSIGKGFAVDRAMGLLSEGWNLPSVLLHGGHSSVYAKGNAPGERWGWRIGLRHPWHPERSLGEVRLRDRGLATSAATHRHLIHEGRKLGHLLDPRTGWPGEGMDSVTVLAPTATEADALATTFFLQGIDFARTYCSLHPEIGALLLPSGETSEPVVLGLGPEELVLPSPRSSG